MTVERRSRHSFPEFWISALSSSQGKRTLTVMYFKIASLACYAWVVYWIANFYWTIYRIGLDGDSTAFRYLDDEYIVVQFGIFLLLLAFLLFSLLLKGQKLWMLFLVLLYFPFFNTTSWTLSRCMPHIVDGLHERILKESSVDELRRFAKECDQKIPDTSQMRADMSQYTPEQEKALDDMKRRYPFLNWKQGLKIQNVQFVEFKNGIRIPKGFGETLLDYSDGSFYWSISIQSDGGENLDGFRGRDPMVHSIQLSKDIHILSIGG